MADLVEVMARHSYEAWRVRNDCVEDTLPWADTDEDQKEESRAEARAALSAIESAGYRVVPTEPDDKMAHVGGAAFDHPNVFMGGPSWVGRRTAKKLWAAMLAAAPKVTP